MAKITMAKTPTGRGRKRASQDDYRRRFEILFSTIRRVSGGESLDEILDALVELTSHEVRCERSSQWSSQRERSNERKGSL